jgi:molybdate transport system ATP-binding protein
MSVQLHVDIAVPGFTVHAQCDIPTGITAFTGPSGAGKSLTLAAIAGLVRPASGHIDINGSRVFDGEKDLHIRSQERGIGMVFQAPSLLDHRSPIDNVALAIAGQKKNSRRELAMHWLERVGAGHLASKNTRQLSGGERQRISLARALVNHCKVLLLDEPFTALDRHSRSAMRQLVMDLAESENLTAVIVSHDVDDIVAMATHIVLFEPGTTVGTYAIERGNSGSVLDVLSQRKTHEDK